MENIRAYSDDLMEFFHQKYKLQNKPQVHFQDDVENSQNPLGKTAQYDPHEQSITVFITGRHVKDCLRSLAHELVHHMQCERGDLENIGPTEPGYAQKDGHMREMEREAYEKGNLCFRDWEDRLKQLQETNYEGKLQGDAIMSTQDWKNKELNTLLMEKWGFKSKNSENLLKEEVNAYMTATNGYSGVTLEIKGDESLTEEELAEKLYQEDDYDLEMRAEEATEYTVGQGSLEEQKLRKTVRKMIKSSLQEQKLRKTIRKMIKKVI